MFHNRKPNDNRPGPARKLPALLGALLLAAALPAAPAPPPAECPEPRFTGKAPDEYYLRPNPLAAGTDLSEAERIYKGQGGRPSCATCHGDKGDGRGKLAGQFDPKPRNFQCAQVVNGIPDGQLFWIIRFGSPDTSMPAHPKLSDAQVWSVVLYLRRLVR